MGLGHNSPLVENGSGAANIHQGQYRIERGAEDLRPGRFIRICEFGVRLDHAQRKEGSRIVN
jgi:hypothetical protein